VDLEVPPLGQGAGLGTRVYLRAHGIELEGNSFMISRLCRQYVGAPKEDPRKAYGACHFDPRRSTFEHRSTTRSIPTLHPHRPFLYQ